MNSALRRVIDGSLAQYLLNPPDQAGGQPNLDPVRMGRRIGKQILYDSFRSLPRPLVLLEHDGYLEPRSYGTPCLPVHFFSFGRSIPEGVKPTKGQAWHREAGVFSVGHRP